MIRFYLLWLKKFREQRKGRTVQIAENANLTPAYPAGLSCRRANEPLIGPHKR